MWDERGASKELDQHNGCPKYRDTRNVSTHSILLFHWSSEGNSGDLDRVTSYSEVTLRTGREPCLSEGLRYGPEVRFEET